MEEIWKDVVGYEGLYKVSNTGLVKSIYWYGKYREALLKQWPLKAGYMNVALYKNRERKQMLTHRVVAEAFLPNPEHFAQVNHIDGNKKNNYVENLEWCSGKSNMQHALTNGLCQIKKKVCQFSLDGNHVRDWDSATSAANYYHCSRQCIAACARGLKKSVKGYIWKYAEE